MKTYSFEQLQAAILGLTIGDALGVPVEFKNRDYLEKKPVKDMMGYGTYNQPVGTWSDDSSLTFCLLEMLSEEYNLERLAQLFCQWIYEDYWTPHGRVFDAGVTTTKAIKKLKQGIEPVLAGMDDEYDNGNGSLMRILPLAFYFKEERIEERFEVIKEISSLTHRHMRSIIACFIYIEYIVLLLQDLEKKQAYQKLKQIVNTFLEHNFALQEEAKYFERILQNDISTLKENNIQSSSYVLHSLETSLWCFLTQENYEDTVLKAVNLGQDTDTNAAIVGGIAGLYYGIEAIPDFWLGKLARLEDIEALIKKFYEKMVVSV